jgi:hypothetical protein
LISAMFPPSSGDRDRTRLRKNPKDRQITHLWRRGKSPGSGGGAGM